MATMPRPASNASPNEVWDCVEDAELLFAINKGGTVTSANSYLLVR